MAGGPVHPAVPVATLTSVEAGAAVEEALALWKAAGLDAGTIAALARTKVTIEPLPAPYLGLAAPGAIYLDSTAEGYGWFTATSPTANPPKNEIDLLTVVSHELGHLFGLMDNDGTPLMVPALAAGARILPTAADLSVPHGVLVGPATRPTAPHLEGSQGLPLPVLDEIDVSTVDWLSAIGALKSKTNVGAIWDNTAD